MKTLCFCLYRIPYTSRVKMRQIYPIPIYPRDCGYWRQLLIQGASEAGDRLLCMSDVGRESEHPGQCKPLQQNGPHLVVLISRFFEQVEDSPCVSCKSLAKVSIREVKFQVYPIITTLCTSTGNRICKVQS